MHSTQLSGALSLSQTYTHIIHISHWNTTISGSAKQNVQNNLYTVLIWNEIMAIVQRVALNGVSDAGCFVLFFFYSSRLFHVIKSHFSSLLIYILCYDGTYLPIIQTAINLTDQFVHTKYAQKQEKNTTKYA